LFPGWPESRQTREEILGALLRQATYANAPLTTNITKFTLFEGDQVELVSANDSRQVMEVAEHTAKIEIRRSELPPGDTRLAHAIAEFARQFGSDMDQGLAELIRQSDQTQHLQGDTPEELGASVLEALQRVDMSFDENGEPTFGFIAGNKDLELLRALDSPEIRARFDGVIEERRREWSDRESHRKLAD
jgi:hypothetical protein